MQIRHFIASEKDNNGQVTIDLAMRGNPEGEIRSDNVQNCEWFGHEVRDDLNKRMLIGPFNVSSKKSVTWPDVISMILMPKPEMVEF